MNETLTMYWRLHAGLFDDRLPEVLAWLAAHKDVYQVVEGRARDLPPPPPSYDQPGLAMTILQDIRDLPWAAVPGAYWDRDRFQLSYYLPRLDPAIPYLNETGVFYPAGMLPLLPRLNPGHYRDTGMFIRPDSGQKPFPGVTIPREAFLSDATSAAALAEFLATYKISPQALCFVAPARPLDTVEWRCWIVNRQVVASSPYSWTETCPWAPAPPEVLTVAEQVAAQAWQPDIAYVADIATMGGKAYLLEFNAASTAGIYQAPIEPLFTALRSAALQEAAGELDRIAD